MGTLRLVVCCAMAAGLLLVPAGAEAAPRANVDLVSGFDARFDGGAAYDFSGGTVARAGDVDGDGTNDLIIGAPGADNSGRGESGSSYLIYGSTNEAAARIDLSALTTVQGFRIEGAATNDQSGGSVAGAGDVNGDGTDDLIVGASQADNNGRTVSGSSYVIYGSTTRPTAPINLNTLTSAQGFRIDGASAFDGTGSSVAGAGDVNADGADDVIIGAFTVDNNGRSDSGSSYVIYGSTTEPTAPINLNTLTAAQGFRIDGATEDDFSGLSTAGAGDVNGDGTDDVIIGANGAAGNGRDYVIYGSTTKPTAPVDLSTLTSAQGFRIDGANPNDLTREVAGAGDVNGDGTDDLIVGAIGAANNGRPYSGASYVIYGSTTEPTAPINLNTLTAAQVFRIDGAAVNDQSGGSVAGAGDVNGDGTDDLIVGAPGADNNGRTGSGSSYLIYGSTFEPTAPIDLNTLTAAQGFRIDGAGANDGTGSSVAGPGDVNGDGTDDLLVGSAAVSNNGRAFSGSSYLIRGVDTSAPTAPQGSGRSAAGPGTATLSGTAEPGATIEVSGGGAVLGTTTVGSDGRWTITFSGQAPGTQRYSVVAIDRAGNRSAATTIDTVVTASQAAGRDPERAAVVLPTISGARLSATRFAVDTRATASRARGAALRYRINKPATVIHSTQHLVRGRWRTIRVFTVRYRTAGQQRLNYSGRIKPRGKARSLRRGRYRLRIRPSDPAGNRGAVTTLRFRIVKR